ncbi:MAG: hypothetical protein KTR30_33800, partial [Saprospiraceae bacterium]|nr:hypothetical protein [Saprospiraceae bacterium]
MQEKKEVAEHYIEYLQAGNLEALNALFSAEGIVISPIYGTLGAKEFYEKLAGDTTSSALTIKGIFEEPSTGHIALYFQYDWTLDHGRQVVFDVVDILTFDAENKITSLKIIYDT